MAESGSSDVHLRAASPTLLVAPGEITDEAARREESSGQCFKSKTRTTSEVVAVEDPVSPTLILKAESDAHSSDNDWEKVSLSEVKDAPALTDGTAASEESRANGANNEENSSFELNDGESRPKRKRTLPAWMMDDTAVDDGEEPKSKGRGRPIAAPRGRQSSSRAAASKSNKDEFENEEEQQPKLVKRGSTRQARKPNTPPRDDFEEGPSRGRAKRATAAKRVSYTYDDYVDDSELSKDSEEFNRKSRSKRRKKDDSEEDWTGDDDSDDEWGSKKKGKKAAGRGRKRSGRCSDDEESDDEAYVPRLSRRRSGLDSVESSQTTGSSVASPNRRGRGRSVRQQSSESPSPSKAASGSGSLTAASSPQKANASVHAKKRKVDLSDDENNDDKHEIDARKSSSTAAKPAADEKKERKICMFGAKCYRKAAEHRDQYSHPGDDDYVDPSEEPKDDVDDKPECEFGTTCFRKNPQHRRDYSHTKPPTRQATKKTQNADSEDDLDDEEEDEEGESESGSDYDPSGDDETPNKKATERGAPAKRGRKEKV